MAAFIELPEDKVKRDTAALTNRNNFSTAAPSSVESIYSLIEREETVLPKANSQGSNVSVRRKTQPQGGYGLPWKLGLISGRYDGRGSYKIKENRNFTDEVVVRQKSSKHFASEKKNSKILGLNEFVIKQPEKQNPSIASEDQASLQLPEYQSPTNEEDLFGSSNSEDPNVSQRLSYDLENKQALLPESAFSEQSSSRSLQRREKVIGKTSDVLMSSTVDAMQNAGRTLRNQDYTNIAFVGYNIRSESHEVQFSKVSNKNRGLSQLNNPNQMNADATKQYDERNKKSQAIISSTKDIEPNRMVAETTERNGTSNSQSTQKQCPHYSEQEVSSAICNHFSLPKMKQLEVQRREELIQQQGRVSKHEATTFTPVPVSQNTAVELKKDCHMTEQTGLNSTSLLPHRRNASSTSKLYKKHSKSTTDVRVAYSGKGKQFHERKHLRQTVSGPVHKLANPVSSDILFMSRSTEELSLNLEMKIALLNPKTHHSRDVIDHASVFHHKHILPKYVEHRNENGTFKWPRFSDRQSGHCSDSETVLSQNMKASSKHNKIAGRSPIFTRLLCRVVSEGSKLHLGKQAMSSNVDDHRQWSGRARSGSGPENLDSMRQKITPQAYYQWVQESDGSFFENFTALSWKQENRRLQAAREDDHQKDKEPPKESDVGISVAEFKIGRKEWESLYVEVLYTIKHKLGANCGGYSVYADDLYDYAQEAFHISVENHRRLFAIAQEEKPPIPILNVVVVEAQGLEAKDANGYSDPYCMLGIQPGNGECRRTSSDEENDRSRGSPRRQGLKKLSASFKRKDRSRSNSLSETLPAKLIRTTTVKPHTLNPKWNERFRLDIDDLHTDRLHLDIWDHDEESSVLDAARKLNEVTGLKGLGRYFKQIAQSAKASSGDNVDDFLGCVNIPLEDIPSSGVDKWFPLEGRSHRSTIQGHIRMKMNLGTRDAQQIADINDNWKEVVEHQELLWIFIGHELLQLQIPTYEWAGDLPQSALTILHQHAIQGNITELQQAMCRWITYSRKHMEQPLDYALLYQLLCDLDKAWGDSECPLFRDEETALAESFDLFVDYSLELVRKHRDIFPLTNKLAEHKLFYLLKSMSMVHCMKAFQKCCPFRHELHLEIVNCVKKGTTEWFHTTFAFLQPLQRTDSSLLRSLIELTNALNGDLQKGSLYYNEMFCTVGVTYSSVTYKQLEKLLAEELMSRLQNKVEDHIRGKVSETCTRVSNLCSSGDETDAQSIALGTDMFELYMSLQAFVRFRDNLPPEERKQMALTNFHLWFSDAVSQWFTVAKVKARQRIQKAIEIDKKVHFLDSYVKHSSSAVDTTTCFVQIKEFWRQLDWPDVIGSFQFVMKIVEAICDGAMYYANLCHQHLMQTGYYDEEGQFDVNEQLCITVNNIEHVRRALTALPKDLELDHIVQAIEQVEGQRGGDQCRTSLYGLLHSAEDDIITKILAAVNGAVEKMRPEIKKYIFHLAWAPDKLDAENAIVPLMDYLDTNMKTLYNNMLRTNFDRVLETIWRVVLQELTFTARSNIGKERQTFFERLFAAVSILREFFHANGKGLTLVVIQNPLFYDFEHLLKLHKGDTQHLIELYCLQKLEEQEKPETHEFGFLTIKTFFNAASDSLCIDVMNARELIPLDPNGYSDPFVIIELLPRHYFPDCPQQKTKIHKKTLYPLFDESFEFTVAAERCRREGAVICFTVMDHDRMTRDDFEGEAFLSLSKIPGVSGELVSDVRPMDLIILRPKERNEILTALEVRTWDKDAHTFLKEHRSRHS